MCARARCQLAGSQVDSHATANVPESNNTETHVNQHKHTQGEERDHVAKLLEGVHVHGLPLSGISFGFDPSEHRRASSGSVILSRREWPVLQIA